MKTVKNADQIKRVPNQKARELVLDEGWKYCPKHEWKEKVRDK